MVKMVSKVTMGQDHTQSELADVPLFRTNNVNLPTQLSGPQRGPHLHIHFLALRTSKTCNYSTILMLAYCITIRPYSRLQL